MIKFLLALAISPLNTLWWAEDSVSDLPPSGLSTNLLAHYRFEEAKGDDKTNAVSPGTFTLQEFGEVATNLTGKITNAVSLYEKSIPTVSHLYFDFDNRWNFTNLNFAVSFWLFLRGDNYANSIVGRMDVAANPFQWYIVASPGRTPRLITKFGSSPSQTQTSSSLTILPTNQWHFLVCNFYSSGSVDWIINNGPPISTTGIQPLYNETSRGFTVGSITNSATFNDFNIDSLSIWTNKTLSSDEINFLYNSGSGKDYNDFGNSP